MHNVKFHAEWLEFNGVKVRYTDGLTYRIQVRTHTARYPYEHRTVSVYAVPISKTSKRYQETRRILGDDWSTDILGSDVSVECTFLRLCRDVTAKSDKICHS